MAIRLLDIQFNAEARQSAVPYLMSGASYGAVEGRLYVREHRRPHTLRPHHSLYVRTSTDFSQLSWKCAAFCARWKSDAKTSLAQAKPSLPISKQGTQVKQSR